MDDDGVRSIGVEPRTSTLGIYECDQDQHGWAAVGTPLWLSEYISKTLEQRPATTKMQVVTWSKCISAAEPLCTLSLRTPTCVVAERLHGVPHGDCASGGAGAAHAP